VTNNRGVNAATARLASSVVVANIAAATAREAAPTGVIAPTAAIVAAVPAAIAAATLDVPAGADRSKVRPKSTSRS
jgi:hypothetical protein